MGLKCSPVGKSVELFLLLLNHFNDMNWISKNGFLGPRYLIFLFLSRSTPSPPGYKYQFYRSRLTGLIPALGFLFLPTKFLHK